MRKRANHKQYAKHTRSVPKGTCEFCELTKTHTQTREEYNYFWVIANIFPYDLWDGAGVQDHLMIIPKRHVDTISHFNTKEQSEYIKIIGEYESRGYSIYARARGSSVKSVVHQHTHLISIDNKIRKTIFFRKKPYLFLHK